MVVVILLEVDMDRGTELTLVKVHINVQECDMGGVGIPCEVDRIPTLEPLKKGDGVRSMGKDWVYQARNEGNPAQDGP